MYSANASIFNTVQFISPKGLTDSCWERNFWFHLTLKMKTRLVAKPRHTPRPHFHHFLHFINPLVKQPYTCTVHNCTKLEKPDPSLASVAAQRVNLLRPMRAQARAKWANLHELHWSITVIVEVPQPIGFGT